MFCNEFIVGVPKQHHVVDVRACFLNVSYAVLGFFKFLLCFHKSASQRSSRLVQDLAQHCQFKAPTMLIVTQRYGK